MTRSPPLDRSVRLIGIAQGKPTMATPRYPNALLSLSGSETWLLEYPPDNAMSTFGEGNRLKFARKFRCVLSLLDRVPCRSLNPPDRK